MKSSLTIAGRELSSLFFSPIAYVVLCVFSLGTVLLFLQGFGPGQPATLQTTMGAVVWLLIILIPAISMRLVSEEFRSGTVESLMTAPISDTQVILGKWLGAMGFYLVLLVPLIVLMIFLYFIARPDWGPFVSGLVGMVLIGGLYMAIGTFASTVNQNQIVAFMLTVAVILVFTLLVGLLPMAAWLPNSFRPTLYYLNAMNQFDSFSKGVIDWPNLVYFLSGISFFLFIAVMLLQSRRWR